MKTVSYSVDDIIPQSKKNKIVMIGSFECLSSMQALADLMQKDSSTITIPNPEDEMLASRFKYLKAIFNADFIVAFAKESINIDVDGSILAIRTRPKGGVHVDICGVTVPGLLDALSRYGIAFGESTSYEFAYAAQLNLPILIVPARPNDPYDDHGQWKVNNMLNVVSTILWTEV